ncbi:MAG: tRNA (adenosine(37)-N6)-threonylcarbamoyltransferase complex dimerization subunit type 1 TsaB [Pseudomonadota bacterium]
MNFLAIDTSTEAQVLGIARGDVILESTEVVGRGHSQLILPSIMRLLDDAGLRLSDLDGIIFGQGPGSFTGLRIAVGVVQGLGYGLDIPVVPVGTMAVMAQGACRLHGAEQVVVALHARKREVYFGSYRLAGGIVEAVGEECVVAADEAPPQPFDTCLGVGSGWAELGDALESACGVSTTATIADVYPAAIDLLTLGVNHWSSGLTVAALKAEPRYLRERVATPGVRS